jgi:WD40 repeat protein
MQRVNKK